MKLESYIVEELAEIAEDQNEIEVQQDIKEIKQHSDLLELQIQEKLDNACYEKGRIPVNGTCSEECDDDDFTLDKEEGICVEREKSKGEMCMEEGFVFKNDTCECGSKGEIYNFTSGKCIEENIAVKKIVKTEIK